MEEGEEAVQAQWGGYPYRPGDGAQPQEPDKEHPGQRPTMERAGQGVALVHLGRSAGAGEAQAGRLERRTCKGFGGVGHGN